MGKSLIIKGADFSANAIIPTVISYYNEYDNYVGTNGVASPALVGIPQSVIEDMGLFGKTIKIVKFHSPSDTTITMGKATVEGKVITPVVSSTYNVTEGINEVRLDNPIILNEGETFFINITTENMTREKFTTSPEDAKGWNYFASGNNPSDKFNIIMSFGNLTL